MSAAPTLGIDLGTSAVKALLLDGDRVVGTAQAPLAVSRPHPGWSEQDPEHWWAATCECLDALAAAHPTALRAVRAIGLAGQMHGATLIDAAGHTLRPCMLWDDGRSAAQCAHLEAAVPSLRSIAGNAAMPGFTAPKLLWVREHEPRVFARIHRVLLPKAWLRWRLSGEAIEDMSDASGTLWLDVAQRRWSGTLLAACGLREAQMPRLVEGSASAGELRAEWVQRWGFEHVPVLAGGATRQRLPVARHLRRVVGHHRAPRCRARARCARFLPRGARHMAPDGRAVERCRIAGVVGRGGAGRRRRPAGRTAGAL
jgi:xylulokinase